MSHIQWINFHLNKLLKTFSYVIDYQQLLEKCSKQLQKWRYSQQFEALNHFQNIIDVHSIIIMIHISQYACWAQTYHKLMTIISHSLLSCQRCHYNAFSMRTYIEFYDASFNGYDLWSVWMTPPTWLEVDTFAVCCQWRISLLFFFVLLIN